MKPIDRLYIGSLILTLGATILMFTGVLLPNWWLQKNTAGVTTRIFGLFGSIHCGPSVCYPDDQLPVSPAGHASTPVTNQTDFDVSTPTIDPMGGNGSTSVTESSSTSASTAVPDSTGSTAANESTNETESLITTISIHDRETTVRSVSTSSFAFTVSPEPTAAEHPPNAGWLVAGRAFSAISLILVTSTLLLQVTYLRFRHRLLQIISLGFLVATAFVSFITGFIFINKFSALTRVYVTERPPGALTYTPAAPGCILIASLLCVVAAVFTLMAFHPPARSCPSSTKKITQEKTTPSNQSALPTSEGEAAGERDEEQLLTQT